jgi:DNA polymerase-3 subunit alpha
MYSVLDGMGTPQEMAQRAADLGQSALAISDHGTLSGCMSFKNACDAVRIKPILGCEVYVAPGSRSDTEMRCLDGKSTAYHLVLLAKNRTGWDNLVRLTTMANYGDAFYKKPRIDFDLLSEYSEGLICLSGCLGSEFAQTALISGVECAVAVAEKYDNLFEGNYYIELQWHGQTDDELYFRIATAVAKGRNIATVATADSHYTYEDEADTHDTLLCIQTLSRKSDEKRFRFSGGGYYLQSAIDMAAWAPADAVANTLRIAEQIETFDLTHKPQMLELPNASGRLIAAVQQGLAEKYDNSTQATLRAGRELDVISHHGFASYFLMVADIVRWSKSHGIAVGPGRGSVGGSLVAYVLGIHAIDPLVHHTMFERFMTMERVSPPDVDLDFSEREPVIQYIEATYGAANVVQIATFMKFGAKAALRDVARVLELPEDCQEVATTASALEGRVRGISRHAAGIIISPHPLEGRVPLMRPVGASKGASLQTAWDYDAVEAAGYEKVDILGVQRLATIQKAALAVGVDIDKACASLDDGDVYALLRRGETTGIFQLDSWAGTKTIKAVRPLVFEDIVAAIALDRPGPYESGAQDQYIARRRGAAYDVRPYTYDILMPTHGIILYQEQCMALAQKAAGFTPGEADDLRRAIAKKHPEQMASLHEKFSTGCIYHDDGSGMSEAQAEELWSEIETHAGYSFNRSHAVAYAVVSYQCAWLKCKYPVAFMCALLNEKRDVQEKLREVCAEVRRMGIPFLGADVRYSGAEYSAEDNGIRIGLTGLVDFGQVAFDELQRVMHEGAPRSLDEFVRRANRAKLNTKSMTALINAGALGYLGDRATLKRELPLAIQAKIEAQHEARLEYVRGHNLTLAGMPRKRPWRALQASEAPQVG